MGNNISKQVFPKLNFFTKLRFGWVYKLTLAVFFDLFFFEIDIQNVKPSDVTLEKALEYLSGDDVRRSGRPKGKSKVQEVEVIEAF